MYQLVRNQSLEGCQRGCGDEEVYDILEVFNEGSVFLCALKLADQKEKKSCGLLLNKISLVLKARNDCLYKC